MDQTPSAAPSDIEVKFNVTTVARSILDMEQRFGGCSASIKSVFDIDGVEFEVVVQRVKADGTEDDDNEADE